MAKRMSLTELWMMSHPNDTPCPRTPAAAQAWRKKRFQSLRHIEEREKYEAMMAEARQANAKDA